jgi:proteasome lid subunit RPN8/RPN11
MEPNTVMFLVQTESKENAEKTKTRLFCTQDGAKQWLLKSTQKGMNVTCVKVTLQAVQEDNVINLEALTLEQPTVTTSDIGLETTGPFCIGIDFGGVLSIHDGGDTSKEHKSTTVNMPDAMKSLLQLKKEMHTLHLISFCGKRRAVETYGSLREGPALFDSQHYVTKKQHKKFVCRFLGCDVMIDDRFDLLVDVALEIGSEIVLIWFQGDPGFKADPSQDAQRRGILIAKSWPDVLTIIAKIKKKKCQAVNAISLNKLVHDVIESPVCE